MAYTATIVDSLARFSDAQLEAVTRDAGVYHDWRWLRMCERIDLAEACRGALSLRFAIVTRGDELVGLCPFFITRSPTMLYHYSLQKLYFTGWSDQLLRINPEAASWVRYAMFGATAYCQMARMIGAGIEGWVLVTSPLSSRGGVISPELPADDAREVYDAAIAALKEVATEERLPLCFNAIAETAPIVQEFERAGFVKVFYVMDNELPLEDAVTVDDYLKRFAHKTRLNFRNEMRSAEKAGYRFEVVTDVAAMSEAIASSYENTYSKYGGEYFVHTPAFWTELVRSQGENISLIVARKGDAYAGFTALLHKGDEMFVFRVGRTPRADGKDPPIYFNLLAWEPIRRALALGKKRIFLAGGAFEAKRHRGARGRPFYNFFWFPNLRSRVVVAPFVSLYGRINWQQVSRRVHT